MTTDRVTPLADVGGHPGHLTGSAPSLPDGVDADLQHAVERFLYLESEILDDRRFEEWLSLFSADATYEAPLRVTRDRQASQLSERGRLFSDTKATLEVRVRRLLSEYAWAEQPPSRTRHFVSNVRARWLDDGAIAVRSNVLVYRNRAERTDFELYSADRHDELVMTSGAAMFSIRRRWFVVDQSNMSGDSLSIFL
ncbi:MAG: aromatic-ring-hydroxylating dioxygenase subunit beta [Acidimicrobiales bacterium]